MKADLTLAASRFSFQSSKSNHSAVIGIDCRDITGKPSGVGEMVQALVDHAPGLAPELRFLLLKHPSAPPRLSEERNVEEVVVPYSANSPTTMWRLPRVVDLSRLSLFHATFNIMPAGLTMPCLATIHDIMWLTHPHLCRPRFSRIAETWFYRTGIKRALKQAHTIATVSATTSSAIASAAPETAPRLRVTMSGVSPDFRPTDVGRERLTRIGLRPGVRFVLTVGQNAPYKNHEGALAAFATAFPGESPIELIMVQRLDAASARLIRQAKNLGIASRVHFLSALERDDLVALYGAATALLHPSLCEGFGNPLAEAMSCGCPVVARDCYAMPEVTGGAALLVDPCDAKAVACALRRIVETCKGVVQARNFPRKGTVMASLRRSRRSTLSQHYCGRGGSQYGSPHRRSPFEQSRLVPPSKPERGRSPASTAIEWEMVRRRALSKAQKSL